MKKRSIFSQIPLTVLILLGFVTLGSDVIAQSGGALFTAGPTMDRTRIYPLMANLPGGKVATFGGRENGFVSCMYADIYDPVANTFSEVPMNFPHDYSCVVRLYDGTYFIVGGAMDEGVAPGYSSCEIYDPVADTFATAGSMNYARMWMSAAQLTDGSVLIAGAWYDNTAAANAEIYDTSSRTYNVNYDNPMVTPRADALMLPTNDGGAEILGGYPPMGGDVITNVEYFSSTDHGFHAVSTQIIPSDSGWLVRGDYHLRPYSDYQMSSGKYLVLAYRYNPGVEFGLLTFDPSTKTFAKIATSTPLVDSLTNGGFYDYALDKSSNTAYLLGSDSGFDPIRVSLVEVNLNTGAVYHSINTFTLPSGQYPMSTMAFMPSNGKLLLEGISSVTSDYYHATNLTYIITPELALKVPDVRSNTLNITAYPNPADEQLNIRFETFLNGPAEIRTYDIMGRIITDNYYESAPKIVNIPVGQSPAGMYFYEILNNNTVIRDKFIKK